MNDKQTPEDTDGTKSEVEASEGEPVGSPEESASSQAASSPDNVEKESQKINPIALAIDEFVHSVLDIRECYERLVPIAIKQLNDEADEIKETLDNGISILESGEKDNEIIAIKEIERGRRLAARYERSEIIETLVNSLFINLFSAFDKLTGSLIEALYSKKPDLFGTINKEISLSKVLQSESIDSLKKEVLDGEIETLRRKSYVEQFKDLEGRFSISLRKFKTWPTFVEAAQRRNLYTHCDGVVSSQYLKICSEAGCKVDEDQQVGDKLVIDGSYFYSASIVVTEVGVMLGQTLWRKILPKELSESDLHLQSLIYDFLCREDWGPAIRLSQFAKDLPKHSDEITRRIIIVNYAIALREIEKTSAAKKMIEREDWTAVSPDFKLAAAVILEDDKEAIGQMRAIGETGSMVTELAYHEWPLFRGFRSKDCFLDAYKDIYGHPFIEKLNQLAEKSRKDSEEHLSEETSDMSDGDILEDIRSIKGSDDIG